MNKFERIIRPEKISIRYGAQNMPGNGLDAGIICLPLQNLQEPALEPLPLINPNYRRRGQLEIWEDDQLSFGIRRLKVDSDTGQSTYQSIYQEIFEATQHTYLYRIWNYLPEINKGSGDKERYKQFCAGRSGAFNAVYGEDDFAYMPAGTCVGTDGDELIVYYLAGKQSPDHHENPNQVPAYRYPRQYGPRSPSFARATSVHCEGTHYRFISGTAAVIGHQSKGVGNLLRQLEVTCDNLELISQQALAASDVSTTPVMQGSGKVYLRHADDYLTARPFLEQRYPTIADRLIYLRSDICRKELLVEIELTLVSQS